MKHLLLLTPLTAIVLASCAKQEKTPESICSSQSTYDSVIEILSEQIAQAKVASVPGDMMAASSSKSALSRVLSFTLPTVTSVNKDTKKIECGAILKVTVPGDLQPFLETSNLQLNETAADHISVKIAYSYQPSADSGQEVITLDQAGDVAALAIQASIAAVKKLRAAAGTEPPVDGAVTDNIEEEAPVPESFPTDTPSPSATDQTQTDAGASGQNASVVPPE